MCSQKPGQRELGQENEVGSLFIVIICICRVVIIARLASRAAKSRFARFHSHSSAIECMWGNIQTAYETAALSN